MSDKSTAGSAKVPRPEKLPVRGPNEGKAIQTWVDSIYCPGDGEEGRRAAEEKIRRDMVALAKAFPG